MISYAQNCEDVLLNRLFPHNDGFYIDVGAHDPTDLSVTKHFYDKAWTGINIEPAPTAFAKFPLERRRDINLNIGVSDRSGDLEFFDFSESVP